MTRNECLEGLIWASWGIMEGKNTREALIHLAHDNGATIREIGIAAGLSREWIRKILAKPVEIKLVTE